MKSVARTRKTNERAAIKVGNIYEAMAKYRERFYSARDRAARIRTDPDGLYSIGGSLSLRPARASCNQILDVIS